jgi:hypothetical protein
VSQHAEFFDGQTAARQGVELEFDASGIQLTGETFSRFWPYADIRYASEGSSDLPLYFRCRSSENNAARLIVADRATVRTLQIRCTDLNDRARKRCQRNRGTLWATAGIVSLGMIIWSSIHFLPRILAPLVPVSWEEAVGDGVVDDIAGIFGTLANSEVKQCEAADGRLALDKLTGLLVSQVNSPYRFKVIVLDIEMVNALAAPGGRIVLFRELLTEAKSADEVAGVLAHEMGHVISRHPTEAVARSMGLSLVFNVLLGGFGTGATGTVGQALVSSAYSRNAERDADSIALDILSGAQISPEGFADFFGRMAEQEGSAAQSLSFISSHPPSDERARAAGAVITGNTKPAMSKTDWKALQAICGEETKKKDG